LVMNGGQPGCGRALNIWNDQQDAVGARDVGWLQIYVEDVQEAVDTTLQAYKIAEDPEIRMPVMVCMDGYILTHVYEPVHLLDEQLCDQFLPPFRPADVLDPDHPKTFGAFADPSTYMDFATSSSRPSTSPWM